MSSLRNSYRQVACPEPGPVLRPMTDTGFIGGLDEMSADFTGQNKKFYVQPSDTDDWRIATFSVVLSSTGSQNRTDYGSINNGLVNGIDFFIEQDGVEITITAGNPIRTNQDLLRNGRDFGLFNFAAGDDSIFAQDNLLDFSMGFILRGSKNEKFGVILNDDLSGLTQHQVFIKAANLGPRVI